VLLLETGPNAGSVNRWGYRAMSPSILRKCKSIATLIYDALMRSCVDFRSISEALDAVAERNGRETMLHMLDVIGAPRDVVEALELVSLRNWQHGNVPAKGRS
jgi:hypothetical protein